MRTSPRLSSNQVANLYPIFTEDFKNDSCDVYSQPLLSPACEITEEITFDHVLELINKNRKTFSFMNLFWHNFFFHPVFYSEASYQALLNYLEAFAIERKDNQDVLNKVFDLLLKMQALGVFTLDKDESFLRALTQVGRIGGDYAMQAYHCIQHDPLINRDAIHPAVVYLMNIISAAIFLITPFVFNGLFVLMAVLVAVVIFAEMGPASRVFEVMEEEENRCLDAYEKSLAAVDTERRNNPIGFFSRPVLSNQTEECEESMVVKKTA